MDYKTIIQEIEKGLGEDSKKNLEYLEEELKKYVEHPMYQEIKREIGKLMYNYSSEEEKREFDEAFNRLIQDYANRLNQVLNLIQEKKFDEAFEISQPLVDDVESSGLIYENNEVYEFHCFRSPFEEMVYRHALQPTKELVRLPYDFAQIFYLHGFLLLDRNEVLNARAYLEKAANLNKVRAEIFLELAETYKREKNLEKMFEVNKQAFDVAFTSRATAKCYRNFAYYFASKGSFDSANDIYQLSNLHHHTAAADKELENISKLTEKPIPEVDMTSIQFTLAKENIRFGANPKVVQTIIYVADDAEKNQAYETAKVFYELLFDISRDQQVKAHIAELDEKIKEKKENEAQA